MTSRLRVEKDHCSTKEAQTSHEWGSLQEEVIIVPISIAMGGQSDSGPSKDCFPNASSMDHHTKDKSMENKYTNNVEAPKFVAKDFASIRLSYSLNKK